MPKNTGRSTVIRLALIFLPALLFALSALSVQTGASAGFDGRVYAAVSQFISPQLTAFMRAVTFMGSTPAITALCLLSLAFAFRSFALPAVASVILSTAANNLLKYALARPRPEILRLVSETGYSFPSGHSTAAMSLYGTLALLLLTSAAPPRVKTPLIALCSLLTAAVGFSRVYLGVHYATDVLGGWCLALFINLAVIFIWEKVKFKLKFIRY